VIAAPNDMWLPKHHYDEMRAELPDLQVRGGGEVREERWRGEGFLRGWRFMSVEGGVDQLA